MTRQIIAIPTNAPGGLAGTISDHFGQCKIFTLIEITNGTIINVKTLANEPHHSGGCRVLVTFLQDQGIDTIIAAGMGTGPYWNFTDAGISVLLADRREYPDVQSVISGMLHGKLPHMHLQQLCKGSANCHQHARS